MGKNANLAIAKKRDRIKVARRRARMLEMYNKGNTQAEMAEALDDAIASPCKISKKTLAVIISCIAQLAFQT